MTKTYHTMDKAEWLTLVNLFHPQYGSHYIDLPNGRILFSAVFADEGSEEAFCLQAKSLRSLPHPVFAGTDTISAEHAEEVGHLFDSPEESQNATVRDVAKKASEIHPLLRLSMF